MDADRGCADKPICRIEPEMESCGIYVEETHPSPGEVDFYVRDVVYFELSSSDSTASVSLWEESGSLVMGTSVVEQQRVSFFRQQYSFQIPNTPPRFSIVVSRSSLRFPLQPLPLESH